MSKWPKFPNLNTPNQRISHSLSGLTYIGVCVLSEYSSHTPGSFLEFDPSPGRSFRLCILLIKNIECRRFPTNFIIEKRVQLVATGHLSTNIDIFGEEKIQKCFWKGVKKVKKSINNVIFAGQSIYEIGTNEKWFVFRPFLIKVLFWGH